MAGAAAMLPWRFDAFAVARPGSGTLTTLGQTIVKGRSISEGTKGKYFRLAYGPGEAHLRRTELAKPRSVDGKIASARRSILHFAHFTDIHIIDAQSPARVEFLDRYADPGQGCESVPFSSAHRPQETLTLHVLESMIRQINGLSVSPVTGKPITAVVCTGDNIDNEQFNELRWFIDVMDGGKLVNPASGGGFYEGVQDAAWGDPEYWHPEPGAEDKYKQQWGFPDYPGLFKAAAKPFKPAGLDLPWYQTFGNHDGLLQGNAPRNALFETIAVSGTKFSALPPGLNPCDAFETLRTNPAAFAAAPVRPVTADATRRIVTRKQYIEEMFETTGSPKGHGLTKESVDSGVAYWHNDDRPGFRFIGLDTVNPGGESNGSIGQTQLTWLEERLKEVSSRYLDAAGEEVTQPADDRYVILFSHHGLRSLDNVNAAPDPLEPASNDLPRKLADEVEAVVQRYPNVIAWVNGHSHENIVVPRPGPAGGFWDIGTAAHIDWSCQSRLIEVIDNHDGTLSIICTMVDHAAPAVPGGADPVLELAAVSRELAANDYQFGFEGGGPGTAEDRNVELFIKAPFKPKPQKKGKSRTGV
jgi:metallophosphoesterase (TIGR03767 family)